MTSSKHSIYFLILLASSYYQFANADLVSHVCSKSRNPTLCNQVLKVDQPPSKVNFKLLAQIVIDKSKSLAKSGGGLAAKFLGSEKDSKKKELYKTCVKNYDDAIEMLDECISYLNSGDHSGLNVHASSAMDYPGNCDDEFEDNPSLGKEPHELSEVSKELQDLCNIILVISNML